LGMEDLGMEDLGMEDLGMEDLGMEDLGMEDLGMEDLGIGHTGGVVGARSHRMPAPGTRDRAGKPRGTRVKHIRRGEVKTRLTIGRWEPESPAIPIFRGPK
jgi:hypothetical protein